MPARGVCPPLDPKWVAVKVCRSEHGLTRQESAEPPTVPVLWQLGAASRNDVDFHSVLSLVVAIFLVARADCCCSLQVDQGIGSGWC